MSGEVLTPELRRAPPWLSRAVALAVLAAMCLALGALGLARRSPPELLLSGPRHEFAYARAVERLVASARHRVWVGVFVARFDDPASPATALAQALADAAARGVRVQVVLDYGRDRATGEPEPKHEAAAAWLRERGVRVVVDELERTTHLKAVVVDDEHVVIGSQNWTRDALTRNREAAVLLHDRAIAAEVMAMLATVPGWDPEG